jgi:plasmid stability protein
MKNITITIDDDTHRAARVRAAEMGTSVSALVKAYLQGLVDTPPAFQGVREMPMGYTAAPPLEPLVPQKGPEGQPYFVNGKWVFTKDGKPRKPGSLKGKIWVADDFDETPEWLVDAFYGVNSDEPWPDPE